MYQEIAFNENAKNELLRIRKIEDKYLRLTEAHIWAFHQAVLLHGQTDFNVIIQRAEWLLHSFFGIYVKITSNEDGSNQASWVIPSISQEHLTLVGVSNSGLSCGIE